MCVKPSGRMYMLTTNHKRHHHYNGGFVGFDKVKYIIKYIEVSVFVQK